MCNWQSHTTPLIKATMFSVRRKKKMIIMCLLGTRHSVYKKCNDFYKSFHLFLVVTLLHAWNVKIDNLSKSIRHEETDSGSVHRHQCSQFFTMPQGLIQQIFIQYLLCATRWKHTSENSNVSLPLWGLHSRQTNTQICSKMLKLE